MGGVMPGCSPGGILSSSFVMVSRSLCQGTNFFATGIVAAPIMARPVFQCEQAERWDVPLAMRTTA